MGSGTLYSVIVTKRSQDSQDVIRVTGSVTSRPTTTKLRVISRTALASSLHEIDVGARRVLMLVVMLTQRRFLVLCRHLKLAAIRQESVTGDPCKICYENAADTRLEPCNHR